MKPALIIMARVPYVGAVKTRLARDVGAVRAARLYRRMLQIDCDLAPSHLWESYIAMTPDHIAFPLSLPRLPQLHGDLGQRMTRLTRRFSGAVILIGSDIPAITRAHIAAAARALSAHDVVLGPAEDGGYWLIGLRNPALRIFDSVRWSTPHALADTIARAKSKRVFFLETLPDMDHGKDLAYWPSALSVKRGMSSARLHGRVRESKRSRKI